MTGGNSNSTKVVQVTNIAPQATKDQMQNLFGHIGKIEEIRLYPTIRDVSCPVLSRICYVKFYDHSCVAVAQHLTNTVFIDRALIVIPIQNGVIPDEYRALEMSNNGSIVPGLHSADSKLPPELVSRLDGIFPNQVIKTEDPKLEDNNLPEYPPLPVNYDARKIEETRRTVMVYDIKSDWKLEEIMLFLEKAGEVKYGRLAERNHTRYAMVEFSEQKSVIEVLKLHGSEFHGVPLTLYHATQPINKPEAKSNEAAQKEIEEAMSIVKEAQNMISAAIDPVIGMLSKDKSSSSRRRSRSRSRERRRSRSRSRRSRSRKRSKSRKSRSKSRSRSKRSPSGVKRSRSKSKRSPSRAKRSRSRSKRSKSKDRRRHRSRSRRKSRSPSSKSRVSRRKSRSRSRPRKSRSRDRKSAKSHHKKEEKHRRSRSRSKSKRRSGSQTRSSRSKDVRSSKRRSRTPETKKSKRNYDDEKSGIDKRDKRSKSIEKSDNMDISNSP